MTGLTPVLIILTPTWWHHWYRHVWHTDITFHVQNITYFHMTSSLYFCYWNCVNHTCQSHVSLFHTPVFIYLACHLAFICARWFAFWQPLTCMSRFWSVNWGESHCSWSGVSETAGGSSVVLPFRFQPARKISGCSSWASFWYFVSLVNSSFVSLASCTNFCTLM